MYMNTEWLHDYDYEAYEILDCNLRDIRLEEST